MSKHISAREGKSTLRLEDTEDFVAGDEPHLGDTVRVTEGDTDLGGCEAFAGELDDVLNDILWCRLEPCGRCPAVGQGRRRCVEEIQMSGQNGWRKTRTHKCPFRERAYDPLLLTRGRFYR